MLVCIFFPISFAKSDATIEGVSGNKIILTGLIGNNPKHFFEDADKNSTLVNCSADDVTGDYYSIVSSGSGSSSGWAEFRPTSDMLPFIEKGILYVQATADIETSGDTQVTIQISCGNESQQSTASEGTLTTPMIHVTDKTQNIRFSFNTSSKNGKNKFTITLPTIHIYTKIDSVELKNKDQTVSPGQIIPIYASNAVTEIEGIDGNFTRFSKINHQIQFWFDQGDDNYVSVVGTNIVISDNVPTGTVISFRAFCKANSYSSDVIYSTNTVNFTVDAENIQLKVRTDFEHPADFTNEGSYIPNKSVYIEVKNIPNNFTFVGWVVDGDINNMSTAKKIRVTLHKGIDVYAKFVKSINIKQVVANAKIYDKTTNINDEDISVLFDGVEAGHEIGLSGAKFSYGDANAGKNKLINVMYDENGLTLTGADAGIYKLGSQIVPNSFGEILKRDAFVYPQNIQRQYGYNDPVIGYEVENLVDGDVLVGNPGRTAGEKIGKYPYNAGDLPLRNNNYNIIVDSEAYFEIIQREIYLENVNVHEKTYDQTVTADIEAGLGNIYNNEDVKVEITGEFVSSNAGNDVEVKITQAVLTGRDKDNYTLVEYTQPIFGEIAKRQITVSAVECSFVYGEEMLFDYISDDLLDGDELSGSPAIDDKNVGDHEIKAGTLSNPNYIIKEFISKNCTITPRKISVTAISKTKTFGDDDPDLTYTTSNMIDGDTLDGALQREVGEDVGTYEINIGTLKNDNYEIAEFTKNTFTITERTIYVVIQFLDKEYDGTTDPKYFVEFQNNVKNAEFELQLQATLSDKNCGNVKARVESSDVVYDGARNYNFDYVYSNEDVQITKRRVNLFIDATNKFYGDNDPQFTFNATNLVGDDEITATVKRDEGEDVGLYDYYLQDTEVNENYNVILVDSQFEILPREIKLSVDNQTKIFGNEDPEIKYSLIDELCFGEREEDIIDGYVSRSEGESVGVYTYDLSTVSSGKNYIFVNSQNTFFIISKRPVVVTIDDATKIYGDDDPVFQYSVENEVAGEKLYVDVVRDYGEDVGDYSLSCGALNDPRYIIDQIKGKLTITRYTIGIKADEKIKVYGDIDPKFSVSIISGHLKNNDRMENIISGNLTREEGENVGKYQIKLGDLSFGKNYKLEFKSDDLTILQREITITAKEQSKIYGESEPELGYELSPNGLVFDDVVTGKLTRIQGESVGKYKILQGDIGINDNYKISYVSSDFEIIKREIEIVPNTISKEYGDEEPAIDYNVIGGLVGEDVLNGELYREGVGEHEETGKYLIYSTLSSLNYNITFKEHYFTIQPRKIVIQVLDKQKYYGTSDPDLEYKIVSGTILEQDKLQGGLSRVEGETAGIYAIISSFTLGRNYTIQYIKGDFTILPLEITIQSQDYQKTYGQIDPAFSYEIVDGKLINNDKLYGTIVREKGEDVGEYALECGIYNANYNITLLPAKLKIVQKDVYMLSEVYNKIYDGTTVAWLKNPYVSGVIDNVYLDYVRDESAIFETSNVGKDIAVNVYDVNLVGDKAANYNLILPQNLHADITLPEITKDEVSVSAKDPVLYSDYSLVINCISIEDAIKIKSHKLMLKYDINLEYDSQNINPKSTYVLKIKLPDKVFSRSNIYVYQKQNNGEYTLLTGEKGEDNEIIISSYSLGEFYITVDNEEWLNITAFVSIAVIALTCVIATAIVIMRRKKRKYDE